MLARSVTLLGLALTIVGAWILVASGSAERPGPSPTAGTPPAATSAASASASPAAVASASAPAPRPIPEGYRIQIPRLSIDLPIFEGDLARDTERQETPENAAFHLPHTAVFGEGSNTYIYAHARPGMFLSLWNARVGDEVFVSTPDRKVLTYVIAEIRPRVPPNDVSVAMPSPTERLTLQTSTGPDPSDPRFVAIAVPRT